MTPKYKVISEICDGDIVVLHWTVENSIGLKCSLNGFHSVVVLARQIDAYPGPFTLSNIEDDFRAVSLGVDWVYDFDPMSLEFRHTTRPPLGSLVITGDGPAVVSHNQNGRHFVSSAGTLAERTDADPVTTNWRILIKDANGKAQEFFRWPIPQRDEVARDTDE